MPWVMWHALDSKPGCEGMKGEKYLVKEDSWVSNEIHLIVYGLTNHVAEL